MTVRKTLILTTIALTSLISTGCGLVGLARENLFSVVGLNSSGTVISKRANIRSSYAVVAADILEVRRGQTVEVLEEFSDDSDVLWYRVRAEDEDETEGWIEAQHIIKEDSLDKSRLLADQEKGLQPQALGKLRASSNLRLTPEQNDTNILLRLDNGASFEIVDWEFVRKPVGTEEEQEQNEEIIAAEEDKEDEPAKLDEVYDIWYKIRLDPSQSPAPMGWVFGRQVSLQIPSDIVYFQTNDRKFVTWHRLDDSGRNLSRSEAVETDVEVAKPGSWVILTRTNEVKEIEGVEPDFDGILVLAFDRERQEHYTAYHTKRERIEVWGRLPITIEGTADEKNFTVNVRNEDSGEMEEKRFLVFRDRRRLLRVTPPEDLKRDRSKGKKKK